MGLIKRFKNATNKKKVAAILILMIILFVIVYVLVGNKQPQQHTGQDEPAQKAGKDVVATGSIVPNKYTALSFASTGLVEEIFVKEGQKVKQGAVLVRLAAKDLQSKLLQAQANLEKAQAMLNLSDSSARNDEIAAKDAAVEQYQQSFNAAKADYDRNLPIYDKGGISGADFDKIKSTMSASEAGLRQAQAGYKASVADLPENVAIKRADVKYARAEIENIKRQLNELQLVAPFDGTVMYLDFHVGEYANNASTDSNGSSKNTCVQFADISKWRAQTNDLSEMDVAKVKIGSVAAINIDALLDLKLKGTVSHIRPFGENRNGDMTYAVYIDIDGSDPRIKWNMKCGVSIDVKK